MKTNFLVVCCLLCGVLYISACDSSNTELRSENTRRVKSVKTYKGRFIQPDGKDWRGAFRIEESYKNKVVRIRALSPGANFIVQGEDKGKKVCDSRDERKLRGLKPTDPIECEVKLPDADTCVVTVFKSSAKGKAYKFEVEEVE